MNLNFAQKICVGYDLPLMVRHSEISLSQQAGRKRGRWGRKAFAKESRTDGVKEGGKLSTALIRDTLTSKMSMYTCRFRPLFSSLLGCVDSETNLRRFDIAYYRLSFSLKNAVSTKKKKCHTHSNAFGKHLSLFCCWMGVNVVQFFELFCLFSSGSHAHSAGHCI